MTIHVIDEKKARGAMDEFFETTVVPEPVTKGYAPGKNPNSHGNRKKGLSNRSGNVGRMSSGDRKSFGSWKRLTNTHTDKGDTPRERMVTAHNNRVFLQEGRGIARSARQSMLMARKAKESGDLKAASSYARKARGYTRELRQYDDVRVAKGYAVGKNPNSHKGRSKVDATRDGRVVDMAPKGKKGLAKKQLSRARQHMAEARKTKDGADKSWRVEQARKLVRWARGSHDHLEKRITKGYAVGKNPASHQRRRRIQDKLNNMWERIGHSKDRPTPELRAKAHTARKHLFQASEFMAVNNPKAIGHYKKARRVISTMPDVAQILAKSMTFEEIQKARAKSQYGIGKHPNSHKGKGKAAPMAIGDGGLTSSGEYVSAKLPKKKSSFDGGLGGGRRVKEERVDGYKFDPKVSLGGSWSPKSRKKMIQTNTNTVKEGMHLARRAKERGDWRMSVEHAQIARRAHDSSKRLSGTVYKLFDEIIEKWDASKHPRRKDGKFGTGSGGTAVLSGGTSRRAKFGSGTIMAPAGAADSPKELRAAARAYKKGGMAAAGAILDKRQQPEAEHAAELGTLMGTVGGHHGMTMADALKNANARPQTIHSMSMARRRKGAQMVRDHMKEQIAAVGGKVSKGRRVHIIMGLPGSGKSELEKVIGKRERAITIDSDNFKEKLKGFDGGLGAAAVHEESSRLANVMQKGATKAGANMILPLVGKTPSSLIHKIKQMKKEGYTVILHHVDVPNQFAQTRVVQRYLAKGRAVSPAYVKDIQNGFDSRGKPKYDTRTSFDMVIKAGVVDAHGAVSAHNIPGNPIRYAVLGSRGYRYPKR